MKYLVHISRIFVGALFIFSGLIKLNDPVGFSFKLEEYFGPTVFDIGFLEPLALTIAIFVVIFEVILGVFLLLGYKPKFTVWSLLLMIVFFTFLTWYSAYYNKVTDCGCFGDAIKLTPWESFTKDIILLVFILILFFGVKHITCLFSKKISNIIAGISLVLCVIFCYHVLNHLPVKDFRPFKIGNNIQANMTVPDDAPNPVIDYHWKFMVDGKEQIITTSGSYPTVEGEYISVETETVVAGYEPPIHDFSMERDGEDHTDDLLNENNLIVFVTYNLAKAKEKGLKAIAQVAKDAILKGYKVIGLTASGQDEATPISEEYGFDFDFYFCDETALKTILRSNPGILELDKGTIKQKLHFNDADELVLLKSEVVTNLNLSLKRKLDSIRELDQKYRGGGENWDEQMHLDSLNTIFIENVFKTHGYPGKSLVGEPTNTVAWLVIQHSKKIGEYLPLIKKAAKKGELPQNDVAMMEDRYLMQQNLPQIYGTQGRMVGDLWIIWPIEDPENVNKRRVDVGFTSTVEEYSKRLFGEEFIFENYTMEEVEKLKN